MRRLVTASGCSHGRSRGGTGHLQVPHQRITMAAVFQVRLDTVEEWIVRNSAAGGTGVLPASPHPKGSPGKAWSWAVSSRLNLWVRRC
jgi:hypothetical protein